MAFLTLCRVRLRIQKRTIRGNGGQEARRAIGRHELSRGIEYLELRSAPSSLLTLSILGDEGSELLNSIDSVGELAADDVQFEALGSFSEASIPAAVRSSNGTQLASQQVDVSANTGSQSEEEQDRGLSLPAVEQLFGTADVARMSEGPVLALPFKLSFAGQITVVPPFEPGALEKCEANLFPDGEHPGRFLSGFDSSTGEASHLGRFDLQAAFCFGFDDPVSEGEGTFTAVNGRDSIDVEFENVSIPDPSTGVFLVEGTQTVTGGTGRFEDASGEQICHFVITPTDDPLVATIEGGCHGEIVIAPNHLD